MDTEKPLLKDLYGDDVDVHLYRSMIGSLMYLTSSMLDIMFAVCACARFQVTPKVSHSHAVKRIFRYLKGQPNLGLWYPRNSPFDLVAYSDSDYVGASLDRISTFWGTTTTRTTDDGEVEITSSIDGQVKTITEASLRRHLKLEDSEGITSLPNTEIFEQLALIGPHDSPLPIVYTIGSDEGSLQQNKLMDLVTKLTDRVEVLENDLQQTKKVYSSALTKLITRVKKLEHRVKTRQPRRRARVIISDTEEDLEDPSKQGRRIAEIDQKPSISLPTELVEDLGSGEKGEKEISTANISVSTTSATLEVSTTSATLEVSTCDNRGLSRLHSQSIERDCLIGIGFVLDFMEIISFTFGDKEMILVIEAVSR
ncbi:hypothetical protein Tco_0708167 [Tanacetum coccineum]